MMQRQTRSSLFPYTTLFRSDLQHDQADEPRDDAAQRRVLGRLGEQQQGGEERQREGGAREQGTNARDRKSTRLNSSHLVISYAVFCLKKKKNKQIDKKHQKK